MRDYICPMVGFEFFEVEPFLLSTGRFAAPKTSFSRGKASTPAAPVVEEKANKQEAAPVQKVMLKLCDGFCKDIFALFVVICCIETMVGFSLCRDVLVSEADLD